MFEIYQEGKRREWQIRAIPVSDRGHSGRPTTAAERPGPSTTSGNSARGDSDGYQLSALAAELPQQHQRRLDAHLEKEDRLLLGGFLFCWAAIAYITLKPYPMVLLKKFVSPMIVQWLGSHWGKLCFSILYVCYYITLFPLILKLVGGKLQRR